MPDTDGKYKSYFDSLENELMECHCFPRRIDIQDKKRTRIYFPFGITTEAFGIQEIRYEVRFGGQGELKGKTIAGLYISTKEICNRQALYDALAQQREQIDSLFPQYLGRLMWECKSTTKRLRISGCREGDIEDLFLSPNRLDDIKRWHIDVLLVFKTKIKPLVKNTIKSEESRVNLS